MNILEFAFLLLLGLIGWALYGLWGAIGGVAVYFLLTCAVIVHSMVTEPWKWRGL